MRTVHPIETESYRRLRAAVDLSGLPPLSRAVAERVIHTSADIAYADDLVLDEQALAAGQHALQSGAPIVTDVRMVAAGITSRRALCGLDEAVPVEGETRSAAGIRAAAAQAGPGAVYVVGNAPTALFELLDRPPREPALIVGLPVGFVGAAEAKAALAASGLPFVANRGEKGGSAVAAAAINALLYFDEDAP